jgi:hypothetical protein
MPIASCHSSLAEIIGAYGSHLSHVGIRRMNFIVDIGTVKQSF